MGEKPEKIKKVPIPEQFETIISKSRLNGTSLFFGHSWIVGVTDNLRPKDMEKMFAAKGMTTRIDSVAVVGAHLAEIEKALKNAMKKRGGKKYEFTVFMAGGNDLGLPAEQIVAGIERLYALAKTTSDHVYVCNLHPYIPATERDQKDPKTLRKIKEVNALLEKSKMIPNDSIIDVYSRMVALKDFGLHPRQRYGYTPVKELIEGRLVERLGKPPIGIAN